ncbi:hypothetical protein FRC00_005154 [Tulasnella sp. 408]|nr:hypothetical protein FRC00_005154 [Tulasnella sp. 408]
MIILQTQTSAQALSQAPTVDRYTMEGAAQSTRHCQADGEIETQDDSDAEMEIENPEEIELKSYITDDVHIVPEIVNGIRSVDCEVQLIATVKLRRLMHVQKLAEVARQLVIDSGLLEPVVEMLFSDDLELCAEAAWFLIGVTSGTWAQTRAVAAAGAIPNYKLVALFPHASTEVLENRLSNLGNIGGDSHHLRDLVVQEGRVKPVLDILGTPEKYEPRVGQQLGYEVTRPMIPVLIKFIQNTTDETLESFRDVLKSLGRISFDETAAEAIIAAGITPRLVELCAAKDDNLRYHAVECLGEFIVGDGASAEAPIQAGFLTVLKSCINCEHVDRRRAVCWAASSIRPGRYPKPNPFSIAILYH